MAPNPLQAQPAAEREVAAIIAFAARYYSGLPFEVHRRAQIRGLAAGLDLWCGSRSTVFMVLLATRGKASSHESIRPWQLINNMFLRCRTRRRCS